MVRELGSMVDVNQADQQAANPFRAAWYEDVIGGDRETPAAWSSMASGAADRRTGGGGTGTPIVQFRSQLNAAMTTLGRRVRITDVDLSPFTSF